MASTEPVSPKMVQAPEKARKVLDPELYEKEVLARRGDIRTMEYRLGLLNDPPPGWEWHWFNDFNGRIEQAIADGWRFVSPDDVGMPESVGRGNDDIGGRVSRVTTVDGTVTKVTLMEIPIKMAEELRFLRGGNKVKQFEDTINRGGAAGIGSAPHIYNPGETPGSSMYGVKNHLGQQAA